MSFQQGSIYKLTRKSQWFKGEFISSSKEDSKVKTPKIFYKFKVLESSGGKLKNVDYIFIKALEWKAV